MYTRMVDGRELEFGVSGKLYKDALVMFDRETGTLWTQVDGSVLRGELEGAQLEAVPLTQTTWKAWKKMHPDTLALEKDKEITESRYTGYMEDPERFGISGNQDPDDRLDGKAMIVSLRDGLDALAIPVAELEKRTPFYQTELNGRPIVVVWNRGSRTARVFEREFDGELLDFYVADQGKILKFRDKKSGTTWNGLTGEAVKGEWAGRSLEPVHYMVNFWWAWAAYNPHTRIEP